MIPPPIASGSSMQSQASATITISQPMLAPVRMVVDTHMSVAQPKQTTRSPEPAQAQIEVGTDEGGTDRLHH